MSLHVLVLNEIEDYREVLFYYFSLKWSFFCYFVGLFCIVWYVIATSSWIFTPNLENVTSNIYFGTPCGFKGSILPEVI